MTRRMRSLSCCMSRRVYDKEDEKSSCCMSRRVHDKEDEKSKLFLLEQAAVKCMRGILMAMMGQRDKETKF